MFKRLSPPEATTGPMVTFHFDEQTLTARSGDTIAAALLTSGISICRSTPVSNAPRAPYCMMGVCFECLVEVDGNPNIQACQVEVRDGMRIHVQQGARRLTS
ncbi:(2Fe-2S)-binding protein [Vreelandella olivaria]|uniref:(2Fe-2S)-binding protein n=1 Tax=Vreelandella olivaria TaxID=390919 RepID=UPI00201F310D|nr:(2Fe-2S)-binding protein [Halomonas olivaria]